MSTNFTFAGTPIYSPPARAVVNFSWRATPIMLHFSGSPYTPPAGNMLALSWQAGPHPLGFVATVWGGSAVILDTLKIKPIGLNAQLFGLPDLDWTQQITPGGKSHMLFGTTAIYNLKQEIKPTGLAATKYGTSTIYNTRRYVQATGFSAAKYGTAYAYRLLQRVWPTGFVASKYGTPLLDNLRQYLTASGFKATAFGTAHPYNLRQRILPPGFAAMAFGLHNTYNLKRYVNAAGAKHTAFGTQFIQLMSIRPSGWRAVPKFGAGKAYNKTSIIAPTGRAWDVFGAGTHVDLHKFTISGLIHTKWGQPLVKNALQRVYPHPATMALWGRPWVSNKHRRVNQYYTLVWMEQPGGGYDYSYPTHTKMGTPLLTHKHIKPAGLNATRWGATWISGPQRIEPRGIFDLWMGNKHNVSSTIRDITPYWTDLGQFGAPSMSPLYLRPKGEKETVWGSSRVGGTTIKNASVGVTQRFGAQLASYNPRYVYPTSLGVKTVFGYPPWGVMHTCTQFIRPPLLHDERWGREEWDYRLGLHVVYRDRRLMNGFDASRFGTPTLMDGERWRWENTRLSKVRFEA